MGLTLVKAWTGAKQRLQAAGLAGPVIDARLLVEAAAEATRVDIVTDPHRPLTPEQEATLEDYLARRERREPVSHILGRKGFWKIMLSVTPDVLTPRPDTETVVEFALRDFPEQAAWSILDLGVGSGAILLALLADRPAARGLGVDVSEEALAVARENAANLGLAGRVALLRGDWADGLGDATFDLVVSNPPYIAS
ncbi:MAG: hemK, partial [Phenylobacterium sp.]|nr:hemK [Phenylobacterium sp.]